MQQNNLFNRSIIEANFQKAVQKAVANDEFVPVDFNTVITQIEKQFQGDNLIGDTSGKVEKAIYQKIKDSPGIGKLTGVPNYPFRFWR